MIIPLSSLKVGTGKRTIVTTVAVALACGAGGKGCAATRDVILVDADRQGTSAKWAGDRDGGTW